MTMRMSILLEADGKQAKVELTSVAKSSKEVEAALSEIMRTGKLTDSTLKTLSGHAKQADASFDGMSAAADRAAHSARGIDESHKIAAGSVGNLTAQFNDIGVMLMAGQNPLQLAIQQGTQITQVLGPMGAKGAVRALGPALMSMVSPISLITLGSIAAGAAMIQWLTGADGETQSLTEAVEDLAGAMDAYRDAADAADQSSQGLEQTFGAMNDKAQALLDKIVETKREALNIKLKAAISVALDETDLDLPKWDFGDQKRLADEFDLSLFGFNADARHERQAAINAVLNDYTALAAAADQSVEAQIAALEELIDHFRLAAEMSGEVTASENSRIAEYEAFLLKLYELKGRDAPDEAAIARRAEVAWSQYFRSRILGEREVQQAAFKAQLLATYGNNADTRTTSDAATDAAQQRLADLREEIGLSQVIAQYGEDSVFATEQRADAERAAFEELVATMGVSEGLTSELLEAFNTLQALSAVDAGAGIRSAVADASALADEIQRAVNGMIALGAQGVSSLRASEIELQFKDDPVGRAGALAAERFGDVTGLDPILQEAMSKERDDFIANARATEGNRQELITYRSDQAKTANAKSGGGGAGSRAGRASSAEKEREQVTALIGKLDQELAVLRETDPVQKEMLRNRAVLANATEAEREQVQKLIESRNEEEAAMERLAERQALFEGLGYDAMEGLIVRGESAKEVIDSLTDALAKAALKALLLGEGPLAGMFGTSDDGGIFGMFTSLFVPGKADGGEVDEAMGVVHGIGGGQDDKLLHWLSAGEYVVNASATARNRGLLEAINTNAPLPGLAMGGLAGGGSSSVAPASGMETQRILLELQPSPLFETTVKQQSQGIAVQAISQYDATQLPQSMRRVQSDPRRIG